MRTPTLIATLVVAASLSTSAFAQETVTPITSSELEAIAAGEVLIETERGSINRGEVIGFVNAPASEITAIVRDSENHDQWFPDTQVSTLVSHTSSTSVTSGRTHVPVLRDRFWQLIGSHETTRFNGTECDVLNYAYDHTYEDGNMDELYGYWLICPLDEGTAVKYVINADLGMAMPRALITWAQNRMLPGIIEGLGERHAEVY